MFTPPCKQPSRVCENHSGAQGVEDHAVSIAQPATVLLHFGRIKVVRTSQLQVATMALIYASIPLITLSVGRCPGRRNFGNSVFASVMRSSMVSRSD